MRRLDDLVASARTAAERRREATPAESLIAQLGTRDGARPFSEALSRPGLSVIAEFKRRSPSAGEIRPGADVAETVAAYERGGAAALSVLTDEDAFGGSLDDIRAARAASALPILRKDFVVDPYQLLEAAVSGADAVLLIVAALDDSALLEMREEARILDLDCLVEVHDADELGRALEADPDAIGINNRDLRDLSVNTRTAAELVTELPAGRTVVAESGYESREQLAELEQIGIDAVLIGEHLLRAPDPAQRLRELTGAVASRGTGTGPPSEPGP